MRVRWRDFRKGLFAGGSREAVPQGFARRLKGFSHVGGDFLRLRYAHNGRLTTEVNQTVHSITRHGLQLYYGAGRGFGFGSPSPGSQATPTTGTTAFAHLSNFLTGDRLTFVSGKPVAGFGTHDYLYCCGGGLVFKTRTGLTGFSRWGMPAPTAPITGGEIGPIAGQTYMRPSLFNFNSTTGWTTEDASISSVGDSLDSDGANLCMQIQVGANESGRATANFTPTANFAQFGPDYLSSDQDWMVFDIKVFGIHNLNSIELHFILDPSGNARSALTFSVVVDDALVRDSTSGAGGLNDISDIAEDEEGFIANPPPPTSGTSRDILERISTLKISAADGTWTRLKIPKAAFSNPIPAITGGTSPWAAVYAFAIVVNTNNNDEDGGGCRVRINNGSMFGGVGMQGHYKYCYTLKDPATGVRSNPSPIFELDTFFRSGVRLNVPLAPTNDPEVIQRANLSLSSSGAPLIREVWRTFGNGTVFFKHSDVTLPIGTAGLGYTHVVDRVADFRGMHDLPSLNSIAVADVFFAFGILGQEVLTFDNIAPSHFFNDVFGLADGRMWWTRDLSTGAGGRVYYSPVGRIESVEGFIEVAGTTHDTMQKGIIWNGKFVLSARKMYEILGSTAPYQSREILGVPGTLWPHTVVATPYGIVYEAVDGIRVFDGAGSQLLPMDPVDVFFRRDTNARLDAGLGEYQTSFNHYACFYNDEYRWSDGTNTLCFNLRTGSWRHMDTTPTAWHTESVGIECFTGGTGLIRSWEFASIGGDYVSSSQTAAEIAYEFETPGVLIDGRDEYVIQRVYLDVVIPIGEAMTVQLLKHDGAPGSGPTTQALGNVSGTGAREWIEIAVGCAYTGVPGVRLTGSSLTGTLRIHGVEMDLHIPEQPGFGT